MRITLEEGDFSSYIVRSESGEDLLVQTDWDFSGVASSFGWCPCECGFTDGTVDCEHRTVSEMIGEARQFLDDNIGKTLDGAGYFGG